MKNFKTALIILLIGLWATSLFADGITIQSRGAKKGVNDDITSMTGLDNDGIPIAKILGSVDDLLTGQGDIVYSSAANTLARLAIGAANTKIFVNAGGIAPEYGTGVVVGTLNREIDAATGDVAYTGLGFKPSLVVFLSSEENQVGWSIGFDDGTNQYSIAEATGGSTIRNTADKSIMRLDNASYEQKGSIKTFDSDGFTIEWVKVGGAPPGTMIVVYVAFR